MTKQKTFFITGTDTGSGKTLTSCSILSAAKVNGLSTAAVKPVAAGVSSFPQGEHNEDVIALSEYCSIGLSLTEINPVCLKDPIAPHIAAVKAGIALDAKTIARQCQTVINKNADLTLIEGAGGWKVPLSETETMADIVTHLEIPVILVVGMRLGCLNHALLSAQSILADGVCLAGWIANRIEADMPVYKENIAALTSLMPAPMLAEIPYLEGDDSSIQAGRVINVDNILSA